MVSLFPSKLEHFSMSKEIITATTTTTMITKMYGNIEVELEFEPGSGTRTRKDLFQVLFI